MAALHRQTKIHLEPRQNVVENIHVQKIGEVISKKLLCNQENGKSLILEEQSCWWTQSYELGCAGANRLGQWND
jgi:hypothetical protein